MPPVDLPQQHHLLWRRPVWWIHLHRCTQPPAEIATERWLSLFFFFLMSFLSDQVTHSPARLEGFWRSLCRSHMAFWSSMWPRNDERNSCYGWNFKVTSIKYHLMLLSKQVDRRTETHEDLIVENPRKTRIRRVCIPNKRKSKQNCGEKFCHSRCTAIMVSWARRISFKGTRFHTIRGNYMQREDTMATSSRRNLMGRKTRFIKAKIPTNPGGIVGIWIGIDRNTIKTSKTLLLYTWNSRKPSCYRVIVLYNPQNFASRSNSEVQRTEERKRTFSATSLSPTSKVGYMDKEGINLGSAMKDRKAMEMANAASTVFASSGEMVAHSGRRPFFSSPPSSSSPPPPPPPPSPPPSLSGAADGLVSLLPRVASTPRKPNLETAASSPENLGPFTPVSRSLEESGGATFQPHFLGGAAVAAAGTRREIWGTGFWEPEGKNSRRDAISPPALIPDDKLVGGRKRPNSVNRRRFQRLVFFFPQTEGSDGRPSPPPPPHLLQPIYCEGPPPIECYLNKNGPKSTAIGQRPVPKYSETLTFYWVLTGMASFQRSVQPIYTEGLTPTRVTYWTDRPKVHCNRSTQ